MKRGGMYFVAVIASAAVSLLTIPVVISVAGPTSWSGLIVGQTVGAVFAVVVGFGWSVTGPATISAMQPSERVVYFAGSLVTRVGLLIVTAIPYGLVVYLVSPTDTSWFVNAVAGGCVLATGISSSWFFVGESDPARLLLYESAPRVLAAIVAAAALIGSGLVWVFVGVQALGELFIACTSAASILRRERGLRLNLSVRAACQRLGENSAGAMTAITSTAYLQAPLLIVSSLGYSDLSAFALADKVQKFSTRMLSPVYQVSQGYVPAMPDLQVTLARSKAAAYAAGALAIVCASLFAVVLPVMSGPLSAGGIEVDLAMSVPFAGALMFVVVTGVIGPACLVALGRARSVALSTVAGALAGVPVAFVFGIGWGAEGVAWSVVLAEGVVLTYQVLALRKVSKSLLASET